jgi:hypothetical protein
MAVDEAQIGEAVDEELHGEGDEEESHDADEDADAGFAEEDTDAIGAGEDEVADQSGDGDGTEDGQHLPVVRGLADEHHDAGDGAGTGEHGNAERDDTGVFFGGSFLGFVLRFLSGGAARLDHVDADEHEDEATGDLEGGELDAEERKDELSCQSKGEEDDEAGQGGFPRHAAATNGIDAGGDGDEGGNGGEGIDEEEDGTEGEQGELDVGGVEGLFGRSGGRDEPGRNGGRKLLDQLRVDVHSLRLTFRLTVSLNCQLNPGIRCGGRAKGSGDRVVQ